MYRILGADGREYGPVSAEPLRRWIAEGRANAETRTRAEGAAEWKPLAQLPEFSLLFAPLHPPLYWSPRKTNPFAVTGLILGILSITCGLCCYGLPFNILGIIFSLAGLSQIKTDPHSQQGRGLAIAGLALSILSIVFAILFFVLGLAMNSSDILHRLENL